MSMMKKPQGIKINGEIYDEIPSTSVVASHWLVDVWLKLGKPDSPLSESGQKMTKVIIAVWEDLYPQDSKEWYEMRKEYQLNELSIPQQVQRQTGRSLASYPYPIFLMMKKIFPNFKLNKRGNVIKLLSLFPLFRFCNRV
jgi:hypothetical protein